MQESKNTAGMYASLAVVRRLVANFEYFVGDKRMPMRAIIIRIFPYLENLMANQLKEWTTETPDILFVILSTFKKATYVKPKKIF